MRAAGEAPRARVRGRDPRPSASATRWALRTANAMCCQTVPAGSLGAPAGRCPGGRRLPSRVLTTWAKSPCTAWTAVSSKPLASPKRVKGLRAWARFRSRCSRTPSSPGPVSGAFTGRTSRTRSWNAAQLRGFARAASNRVMYCRQRSVKPWGSGLAGATVPQRSARTGRWSKGQTAPTWTAAPTTHRVCGSVERM